MLETSGARFAGINSILIDHRPRRRIQRLSIAGVTEMEDVYSQNTDNSSRPRGNSIGSLLAPGAGCRDRHQRGLGCVAVVSVSIRGRCNGTGLSTAALGFADARVCETVVRTRVVGDRG